MKENIKKLFKEIKKETFIGAATVIILGILLLLGVESLVCKVIGVIALVLGAVFLLVYIVNLLRHTRVSSQLLYAIGMLTVGVIFYFQNSVVVSLLSLFFAVILILDGAVKLDTAIGLLSGRRKGVAIAVLIFALTALVVGFLILLNKISGIKTIGYILIADGVLDIITIIMLSIKMRKALK